MYLVSEAFLQAVQENTRKYYWSGKITTKKNVVYEFTSADIVKGSGYITRQCCGSSEMEIGTVYAAEMGITLLSDIDRYTLEDAVVELSYHLQAADGAYETVPMGIFEVSEANRTAKCLELKAYDYMLRFEKSFKGFETVGTPYEFIALCCKGCSAEFANTKTEIDALPNGAEQLSIYTENDIETYRDVLYFVAQVLGGFFVINRDGKLELKKYGTAPVMTVEQKHRFSSSFSDFITRYTAVSSTNRRTETAEYYALETDDGLTMNLGVNPLLQFGLEETREQLCRNILNDIALINYVPFDSDTIGNLALDLGDVLTFFGGQADAAQITCITSIQTKIGGKQSLKCVGKNPRLARAKSKNASNISGLLNQIEEQGRNGKIGIHTFTNASAYSLNETKLKVISIEFASAEENHIKLINQRFPRITNLKTGYSEFLGIKFKLIRKSGKWVIKSHMTDKAITSQQKKLKRAIAEACRSHSLEQSQHNAIIAYNQMVVGMHEYYNMATMICADVHKMFPSIDKTMKTRLNSKQSLTNEVPEKRKGGMDEYFYQKYQNSKQLRFINGMVVVPVAYCKTCNPMCHSPTVNRYTPEGRAEIHRMLLKDAYIDVLLQLGRDNSTAESIEFCDNRLARFVAVKGKCEISKQQLLFDNVVCHRFIPKEQGGTDEYKNLRIIHKDVAQLIYETDVNTIYKLIEKTGCRESTKLAKLNKWRKNVGREPINLITLKQSLK